MFSENAFIVALLLPLLMPLIKLPRPMVADAPAAVGIILVVLVVGDINEDADEPDATLAVC